MSAASILWFSVQVAMFSLAGAVVFLLLRRRGPSVAAACAATVLVLTLPLLLIAFSPWPRWEIAAKENSPVKETTSVDVVKSVKLDDQNFAELAVPIESFDPPPQDAKLVELWRSAVAWLQSPPQSTDIAVATSSTTWRTWLPWIVAIGVAVGLARLFVGIWAVRGFRSHSTLIDDGELSQLIVQTANQLGTPSVELRESSRLRSAATIGWRHPVLLLPADWRTWTETERRVVIAHELAHIARRDYLLVVIARVVTAIHFYQPLVLWLARQLRVQQELAADAIAATITGSRQTYLTTLAQMALRADDQTIPWPARAFLPSTGLLVKRVTWLKRNKTQEERTMNRRSRWMLAVAMAAIALFVAGIRGPNEAASVVKAAEPVVSPPYSNAPNAPLVVQPALPAPAAPAGAPVAAPIPAPAQAPVVKEPVEPPLHTNKYIPADAKFVAVISPSELAKSPSGDKLMAIFGATGFEKSVGLSIAEIADVQVVKNATAVDFNSFDRVIVGATKAHAWKNVIQNRLALSMESKEFYGKTYYAVGMQLFGEEQGYVYFPDEFTVVAGKEEEIKRIIAGETVMPEEGPGGLFYAPLGVQMKGSFLRQLVAHEKRLMGTFGEQMFGLIRPLIDHTETAVIWGMLHPYEGGKEVGTVCVQIRCDSEDNLPAVSDTVKAVRTLTVNALEAQRKQWETTAENRGLKPEAKQTVAALMATAKKALEEAEIHSGSFDDGSKRVDFELEFELPPNVVPTLLLPSVEEAREAAMRSQSQNNMRQIAIALHNYADAHKRFPPPVVVGKDGKTKHSWRVEILPFFMEELPLYNEYHFDEPWDSEHNRKLIDRMPRVFRDAHDDKNSTSSSYYMVTGKGTFGDTQTGRRLREIIDGTSKTIMLVDAKRDVPWTKPEDIEIDADPTKPLPKFGGYYEGIFNAAFADGHVSPISQAVDLEILRKFFTIGDGEPVGEEQLVPVPPTPFKPAPPVAVPGRGPASKPTDGSSAEKQRENVVNLKKIGLALHNYLSVHKHFPPPVILGEDGKTKHSWRVAVLPYIEGHDVKTPYRFNEPWDSEHNQQVIAEIPEAFRDPFDVAGSINTSYFMVRGKGNFGDGENGRKPREITDGMSHTVMVVEAKRNVPWTKPDDIEVLADQPLPKFGGFLPNGFFNVSLADGSVRTLSNLLDEKILRSLFSIDGGEVVDLNALVPPPARSRPPADGIKPDDRQGGNKPRIEFCLGEEEPGEGLTEYEVPGQRQAKVYVRDKAELTNDDIAKVAAAKDEQTNANVLVIEFTAAGAKKMEQLTEANLRKRLVILVDGKLLFAPIITMKIRNGAGFNGNFTHEEIDRIVKGFNAQ